MSFAAAVIAWQSRHGRHDLPWQRSRDPYAIWVSEIMLQQTQVATVLAYYGRFMARFPDLAALARADLDQVMALWSGLGYYSRARHLHRAAQVIHERHGGLFPTRFEDVLALPGIGRSTAGAIMAFAYGARYPILDGNVKRVLARIEGIEGYPGEKDVADALWRAAERLLPKRSIEAYTQGLMDLGAMVCLRRPNCGVCPVRQSCTAHRTGRIAAIPSPRPRKTVPHRRTTMLVLEHRGAVLLEKRAPTGVWGGLWCLPEIDSDADAASVCEQKFGTRLAEVRTLPVVEHGFTHFSLTIAPRRAEVLDIAPRAAEAAYAWVDMTAAKAAGIPAPVRRILEML